MGTSYPLVILVALITGVIIVILAILFLMQTSGGIKNAFEEMVNSIKNFIKSILPIPW